MHLINTLLILLLCMLLSHQCHATIHLVFSFPSFPQDGWTALILAARYGHKELVDMLYEYGADVLHKKKVRAMCTMCKCQ